MDRDRPRSGFGSYLGRSMGTLAAVSGGLQLVGGGSIAALWSSPTVADDVVENAVRGFLGGRASKVLWQSLDADTPLKKFMALSLSRTGWISGTRQVGFQYMRGNLPMALHEASHAIDLLGEGGNFYSRIASKSRLAAWTPHIGLAASAFMMASDNPAVRAAGLGLGVTSTAAMVIPEVIANRRVAQFIRANFPADEAAKHLGVLRKGIASYFIGPAAIGAIGAWLISRRRKNNNRMQCNDPIERIHSR